MPIDRPSLTGPIFVTAPARNKRADRRSMRDSHEQVAVVTMAPVTQAPTRKSMSVNGIDRTPSLGHLVRITQAPRRNPMQFISIRRPGKRCRLLRRRPVTFLCFRRYAKTSSFADYSGAAAEVINLHGVKAFMRRSD